MKRFCLIVTYHAKKAGDCEQFLKDVYRENIPETVRRENGCLKYDYYQSVDNPMELVLLEAWENQEAQKAHCDTPHMARLREIKAQYMTGADLQSFWEEK